MYSTQWTFGTNNRIKVEVFFDFEEALWIEE